jgi:hypothetical protein
MISKIYNILTDDEFNYLKNFCENFVTHRIPGKNNYYHTMSLPEDSTQRLQSLRNKISDAIKNEIKWIKFKEVKEWWINKITTETNRDDKFHFDITRATAVIYLNDDFEGGEFEYFGEEGEKIKLKPEKNLGLIMTDQLNHRVLPVSSGERFSFIVFIDCETKGDRTLI